jgi:hypothetical protein
MDMAAWASDQASPPLRGCSARQQTRHPQGGGFYIWRSYFTPKPRQPIFGDANDNVPVTANLPKDLFDALVELANKRGVSANTVLQDAIVREKYLSDKEDSGATVLIEEKDKTFKKLVRKT